MKVIVDRMSLVQAIVESLSENEEPEFERIDVVGNNPIEPIEMMSTQLAEAEPPVDDPDFIPATIDELSRSAYVISREVPSTQIEYFYRKLHELLDNSLDREKERGIQTEVFLSKDLKNILKESDMKSNLLKRAIERLASGEDAYSIASEYTENYAEFENDDPDDLANSIQMMSYGMEDEFSKEGDIENPAEDLSQGEPPGEEDSDPEDLDDDSKLPSERTEESYVESALLNVVNAIIRKNMHIVPLRDEKGDVQTTPTLKMDPQGKMSLSDEKMSVVASETAAAQIAEDAIENDSDIAEAFEDLVSKNTKRANTSKKISRQTSFLLVINRLSGYLGKDEDPVSPETAAIMSANNIADTLSKSMGIPKFGPEISDVMMTTADDLENSNEEKVQASSGVGRDVVTREVSKSVMVDALRTVSEERKEKPRRGRPRQTYDMEYVPTPEELAGIESARELAEIEKNMKSLTANAESFGYSGAAGLRQWINKFPLMSWTILMGEEKGGEAFQGYRSLTIDYMLTLADNFTDKVIPAIKSGVEKSEKISNEDREEITNLLDELSSDFEDMRDSTIASDDEEIDPDLLLGDFAEGKIGGAVLRNALNSLFRKDDLAQVSNHIEKEMIPFLVDEQGLSKKAATKLAHMFNGRVKMTLPTDLKKAAAGEKVSKSVSNVYDLGIGYDEMAAAQKKAASILGTWFNEDIGKKRRRAAAAKGETSKFSRDKIKKSVEQKLTSISDSGKEGERIKYLADLLDSAISATAGDAELEVELEKMKMPKAEREE